MIFQNSTTSSFLVRVPCFIVNLLKRQYIGIHFPWQPEQNDAYFIPYSLVTCTASPVCNRTWTDRGCGFGPQQSCPGLSLTMHCKSVSSLFNRVIISFHYIEIEWSSSCYVRWFYNGSFCFLSTNLFDKHHVACFLGYSTVAWFISVFATSKMTSNGVFIVFISSVHSVPWFIVFEACC